MTEVETTARCVVGALGAFVACMLALSADVSAEVSHDTLWGESPGSCANRTKMENHGLASALSPAEASWARRSSAAASSPAPFEDAASDRDATVKATDATKLWSVDEETSAEVASCFDAVEDSDEAVRSHRLCLERADVPASLVPKLVAEVRALEQTDGVLDTVHRLAKVESAEGESSDESTESTARAGRTDGPKSLPLAQVPTPPNQPDPDASCTASNPDRCRSLPPRPTLDLESSPTAPRLPSSQLEEDGEIEPDEDDPSPAGPRVGPAEGYDSPPDKPPKRSGGIRT